MTQPVNQLQYSTFTARKNSTARYECTLVDEEGEPIPAGTLTTLVLTLRNASGGDSSIINSRSDQNVLNANGVTVDSDGLLVWTMEPADNPIVGTVAEGAYENHSALFAWTWDSGNKKGSRKVNIRVQQLAGA